MTNIVNRTEAPSVAFWLAQKFYLKIQKRNGFQRRFTVPSKARMVAEHGLWNQLPNDIPWAAVSFAAVWIGCAVFILIQLVRSFVNRSRKIAVSTNTNRLGLGPQVRASSAFGRTHLD